MNNEPIDWKLFFIVLFGGWLGLDKLYGDTFKKRWKIWLLKLLANFIGLGELWNILDFIMLLNKNYRVDPRDYLELIENRNKF